MAKQNLTIRNRLWAWGQRTYLMGVLNVTPDSFSDGGKFTDVDLALAQARAMVAAGADVIDIGGESAQPGAIPVDVETELDRTIPTIVAIRKDPQIGNIPLSIDTTKSIVAEAAIIAGADLVNDISGGVHDSQILDVVARYGVFYILMHMRGTPATMQTLTDYEDVITDIINFYDRQIQTAINAGIDRDRIILDPGIGFAKTADQSLQVLQQLRQLDRFNLPLLIGVSRKSFIGKILDRHNPLDRLWGTAAACSCAISNGADILRVHDVAEIADVSRVTDAIVRTDHPV
jgi:dihydropteroate synthase